MSIFTSNAYLFRGNIWADWTLQSLETFNYANGTLQVVSGWINNFGDNVFVNENKAGLFGLSDGTGGGYVGGMPNGLGTLNWNIRAGCEVTYTINGAGAATPFSLARIFFNSVTEPNSISLTGEFGTDFGGVRHLIHINGTGYVLNSLVTGQHTLSLQQNVPGIFDLFFDGQFIQSVTDAVPINASVELQARKSVPINAGVVSLSAIALYS